ncbi:MAG: glycosyltransferase family 9 protein, partial [Desulfobacteraceae bacterium]|nr:glycosyltransferase family 9 protein [Desulfobacteraceae bacterium]
ASVIVGGRADFELGEEIVRASGGRAVNLAGKTSLRELAALIGGARFVVCVDTGPMHVAAALRVPAFAIFGPTSPARTGPYGTIHTVIRTDLPCSPCFTRKPCPDWRCMTEITPEHVLEIIESKQNLSDLR